MVNLGEILKARYRIQNYIHKTPLMFSETLSEETSANVYVKLESLQKTGAFKIRGIYNKVLSTLERLATPTFVTASSGNHGLGLAYVCRELKIPCTVVVPTYTPHIKINAIQRLGANLILDGNNWNEAYLRAEIISKREESILIHPFEDESIICGQGTIGLEILEEIPHPNYFFASIGGGSMIASNALVFKELSPRTKVIGLQTYGGDAMYQSVKNGRRTKLKSITSKVESFATKEVGKKTFALVQKHVDEIYRHTDQECEKAALFMLERSHILLELSASICVAALLKHSEPIKKNETVVLTFCGGNYDLNQLASMLSNSAP